MGQSLVMNNKNQEGYTQEDCSSFSAAIGRPPKTSNFRRLSKPPKIKHTFWRFYRDHRKKPIFFVANPNLLYSHHFLICMQLGYSISGGKEKVVKRIGEREIRPVTKMRQPLAIPASWIAFFSGMLWLAFQLASSLSTFHTRSIRQLCSMDVCAFQIVRFSCFLFQAAQVASYFISQLPLILISFCLHLQPCCILAAIVVRIFNSVLLLQA